jgi:D-glycero-alpha-D-manno-heptose-7-phosphate kinase
MIITRAPLRVSFFGGGTDYYYFNKLGYTGTTLSCTINKYLYLTLNENFNYKYKLNYSKFELTNQLSNIKHLYFKKAFKNFNLQNVELSCVSDLSSGKGLSSSSAFTACLLLAIHKYKKKIVDKKNFWNQVYNFEKYIVKQNCGMQDQYIICNGGLRLVNFYSEKRVETVDNLNLSKSLLNFFKKNIILVDTKLKRNFHLIHSQQEKKKNKNIKNLLLIKNMANEAYKHLLNEDYKIFSYLLAESWKLKKTLSDEIIKKKKLKELEEHLLSFKPWGIKLLGAGGGGMFLVAGNQNTLIKIKKSIYKLNSYQFLPTADKASILYDN